MNFLILNRYDPACPKTGGAELFTGEIAKRLVENGHNVTWFASASKNVSEETWQGVKIIRKGNILSVIFHAFRYFRKHQQKIDYVIDEIHAYPFMTVFYVPRPKRLVLIHEIAGRIWYFMMPFPVSLIGDLLERLMFRYVYNSETTLTVSQSSYEELVKYGVKSNLITILPEGLTLSPLRQEVVKSAKPSIIFFGGLRPMKRVEQQLAAVKLLRKDFPFLKFYITGKKKGSYYLRLKELVKKFGLQEVVEFTGFLSIEERDTLIASCWLTLNTSVKEGWGLAVTEAAALGVPSVVYKTGGNVDSVKHLKTGLHTIENNPEMLALGIKKLLLDDKLRQELGENARKFAKTLNWEKTYKTFLKVLK